MCEITEKIDCSVIGLIINKGNKEKECVIEYYVNASKVGVRFTLDNSFREFRADTLRNSTYKNNNLVLYGKGFVGENTKHTQQNQPEHYAHWKSMLVRVYCPIFQEKQPAYIGCTISDEWHNFQIFCDWSIKNKHHKNHQLDKDLLLKGNKKYCVEFCSYIPKELNKAMTSTRTINKNNLHVGVSKSRSGGFLVSCCVGKDQSNRQITTQKYFGVDEYYEAISFYKTTKENHIKTIGEKYKLELTSKQLQATKDWVV